jgi:transposase
MIEPLDRCRRDSTLFQFTSKRLRDFIDPSHILIRIDSQFDFGRLVKPLESKYCLDNGRPGIHPEVMVRALLVSALCNIVSFRRLCFAISENIAFRWFCFLTIDDEVFDHSTISYFIERIGREGFETIFAGFNEELLRVGLLSPKMYADASLVKANVSMEGLASSSMTVAEFQAKAIQENGLFVIPQEPSAESHDTGGKPRTYYQDPDGRLPLNPVDLDARWRKTSRPRRAELCYQENAIVDENGFIMARGIRHASQREWRAIPDLLKKLPIKPRSLCADAGYSVGEFRQFLDSQGIVNYIPFHPTHEQSMLARDEFSFRDDHLLCPEGKRLGIGGYLARDQRYQYVAHQSDCQACPRKGSCLPPGQKRRFVSLTIYHKFALQARERNQSPEYQEHMRKRRTAAEGTFASLDRLGWATCKLRGLWKVDCEGFISALAHNVLKAIRKLRVDNVVCAA